MGTGSPRPQGSPGAKGSPRRGTGEPRQPRGAPLPAPCTMSWGTELWVSEGPARRARGVYPRPGEGARAGLLRGGGRGRVGVPAAWGGGAGASALRRPGLEPAVQARFVLPRRGQLVGVPGGLVGGLRSGWPPRPGQGASLSPAPGGSGLIPLVARPCAADPLRWGRGGPQIFPLRSICRHPSAEFWRCCSRWRCGLIGLLSRGRGGLRGTGQRV